MNYKYDEVMKLILDYGSAKYKLGVAVMSDSFTSEKFSRLDDEKTAILNKICDAIIELTK